MSEQFQNLHKFPQAAQFGDAYTALVCGAVGLQPTAQAFIRNMNRVRGIGALSMNLMAVGMVNEAARVEALFNKKINPHDPRVTHNHPQFDEDLFSEVNEERKRLINAWIKSYPRKEDFALALAAKTAFNMNVVLDESIGEAWSAIQATMAAMLISLWTAFESLAQDTWITTVNLRPEPLATRVLNRNADLGTGTQLKAIPQDQITGHGFDLRNSMGDILFRLRAVDFQQLKTIRRAYKVAFDGQLESIFEAHEIELLRLEAVRNLFVHKGGVIDRKFVERMGNESAFKDRIGHTLAVNGEFVADKANVVSVCSTQLIQAVDKWLLNNHDDQST